MLKQEVITSDMKILLACRRFLLSINTCLGTIGNFFISFFSALTLPFYFCCTFCSFLFEQLVVFKKKFTAAMINFKIIFLNLQCFYAVAAWNDIDRRKLMLGLKGLRKVAHKCCKV